MVPAVHPHPEIPKVLTPGPRVSGEQNIQVKEVYLNSWFLPLWNVFTHVASVYANLLQPKNHLHEKRVQLPEDFRGETNMAAVSLFWKTNMAAVKSCENALFLDKGFDKEG